MQILLLLLISQKYKGHGWMGLKFKTKPNESYSEIILHVRFHQTNAKLQQEDLV